MTACIHSMYAGKRILHATPTLPTLAACLEQRAPNTVQLNLSSQLHGKHNVMQHITKKYSSCSTIREWWGSLILHTWRTYYRSRFGRDVRSRLLHPTTVDGTETNGQAASSSQTLTFHRDVDIRCMHGGDEWYDTHPSSIRGQVEFVVVKNDELKHAFAQARIPATTQCRHQHERDACDDVSEGIGRLFHTYRALSNS